MARWTCDLAATTDRISCAYIDDLAGDFPRFDERRSGLSYRHGWFAGQRERPGGLEFDRLVHLDLLAGGRQIWELPRGDQISEPVFVPRTPDAAEGDGWLLAVAYRAQDDVSDLVVLEALDIARGPVATARLPRRVPNGFHGNWRPAG
jgi:carotenoid cleavage dioxygenase